MGEKYDDSGNLIDGGKTVDTGKSSTTNTGDSGQFARDLAASRRADGSLDTNELLRRSEAVKYKRDKENYEKYYGEEPTPGATPTPTTKNGGGDDKAPTPKPTDVDSAGQRASGSGTTSTVRGIDVKSDPRFMAPKKDSAGETSSKPKVSGIDYKSDPRFMAPKSDSGGGSGATSVDLKTPTEQVAHYDEAEFKLDKTPQTFNDFTYDEQTDGGVSAVFDEIKKKIKDLDSDIKDLSSKYKEAVKKYDKFSNFEDLMNSVVIQMSMYNQFLTNSSDTLVAYAEQAVQAAKQQDETFMGNLGNVTSAIDSAQDTGDVPASGGGSVTPNTPSSPNTPTYPGTPTYPDTPVNPDTPDTPQEEPYVEVGPPPEAPVEPDTPTEPDGPTPPSVEEIEEIVIPDPDNPDSPEVVEPEPVIVIDPNQPPREVYAPPDSPLFDDPEIRPIINEPMVYAAPDPIKPEIQPIMPEPAVYAAPEPGVIEGEIVEENMLVYAAPNPINPNNPIIMDDLDTQIKAIDQEISDTENYHFNRMNEIQTSINETETVYGQEMARLSELRATTDDRYNFEKMNIQNMGNPNDDYTNQLMNELDAKYANDIHDIEAQINDANVKHESELLMYRQEMDAADAENQDKMKMLEASRDELMNKKNQ